MKGKFIAFEGSDGSGKSTVLEKVKEYLDENNISYIITREPGGTKIGEQIRDILMNNENTEMEDKTEALLFAAARAQSVEEKLKKELETRDLVISDRYVLSSLAYQGFARGLGVDGVRSINEFATSSLKPDYTFFLDVDPITVLERKKSQVEADRLEEESNNFHQKVYDGYQELLKDEQNVILIDASQTVEEVVEETINNIKKILEEKWNF